MEFEDLIHTRRSTRKFLPEPVTDEQIKKILEAVNLAPSAGNLQAFQIHIVRKKRLRQELANAALDQQFIAQAPVVMVFCALPRRSGDRYGSRGERLYSLQDATIACTYAMLATTSYGLACVWVGAFDELKVKNLIRADVDERPVAILPIGYPAETPPRRQRRDLQELVTWV